MKLLILDIPDDPQLLPEWLERQITGLDLQQLVSELNSMSESQEEKPSLTQACGGRLDDVLQDGLHLLTEQELWTLLRHPDLLLELQDRVNFEGGEHWLEIPISDADRAEIDRIRATIRKITHASNVEFAIDEKRTSKQSESDSSKFAHAASSHSNPWGNTSANPRRSFIRIALVACGLLMAIAVGTMMLPQPAGWSDPGRLTTSRSPAQVFDALAQATESYRKASRHSQQQLQDELERFIRDCQKVQQLNLPELAALPHPDRENANSPIQTYADWLKVKCKAWEDNAQATLTAMRNGNSDFETASSAYTEIITKLKKALEKQAAALS